MTANMAKLWQLATRDGPHVVVRVDSIGRYLIEELPPDGGTQDGNEYGVRDVAAREREELDDAEEVDGQASSPTKPTPSSETSVDQSQSRHHPNCNWDVRLILRIRHRVDDGEFDLINTKQG